MHENIQRDVVTIRLNKRLHLKIKKLAKTMAMTKSSYIEYVLMKHLMKEEDKE